MGCPGLFWGVLGCSALLPAVLGYCGLHVFACGLRRMCAFSHVIEPTVGFVRSGLFGIHACSRAIEPTVGFVSMPLHVDCSECMHSDVQGNQL